MPEEAAFADDRSEGAEVDAVMDLATRATNVDQPEPNVEQDDLPTDDTEPFASASLAAERRSRTDALYGTLPVSRWAQALTDLPIFVRLDGVSLSDAPGDLLLRRPFPSRLTHSLGVYYLTRQARPRDRALQAAALAHDLGHGPFSHLTEPLMIERLGMGHEERGAVLLREALRDLRGASARLLSWIDADEVTAMMLGGGPDGRGKLLNGLIDYDNLDNVARFLQAAGLGEPSYDPRTLARELCLVTPETDASQTPEPYVALTRDAAAEARAWLADRRRVYRYLGEGERNLAMHAMLRKAVDLAAQAGEITPPFFDATDEEALDLLCECSSTGAAILADAALRDDLYTRVWEATAPVQADALTALFEQQEARLAIEERVAIEAGLFPHQVALSYTVARGERELPPTIATQRKRAEPATNPLVSPIYAAPPERTITLFMSRSAGRDYARRARMAAERALGALGAVPRPWSDLS
ncbi:MAG TPA: HD domain-containing protein [Ktedonobacterales bacterium]|nr:HD domain-containing protein [Ktedonobacterales bacterium]